MRFKKTRIVLSVFCGVLCLLLVGLWVRSYWTGYVIEGCHGGNFTYLETGRGTIYYERAYPLALQQKWKVFQLPDEDFEKQSTRLETWRYKRLGPGVSWCVVDVVTNIAISIWLPTLLSLVLACFPWFPWSNRFSLCTLMIFTTFVSLVLGLIFYFART